MPPADSVVLTVPALPAEPAEPTPPAVPAVPVATAPPRYAIGGTLTGLAANTSLVLLDNGGDALTLATNGAFGFAAPVAFNTTYAVTVGTQPPWQNCSVSLGSGTVTAEVNNVQVDCIDAEAQVTAFAGSTTEGSNDGTGAAASFLRPSTIAVDVADRNVYVADSGNNMIRKITPAGVVTTLAGSTTPGSADGTGAAAQFNNPTGVGVDRHGNVYVGESGNNTIRKISPSGVVTTLAGSTPGFADGTGANALFNGPWSLDVDANGNVYVVDGRNSAIRKITPGGVVTTLAGSGVRGSADGQGTAASFNRPSELTVGPDGNVYVADGNHRVRKVTPPMASSQP